MTLDINKILPGFLAVAGQLKGNDFFQTAIRTVSGDGFATSPVSHAFVVGFKENGLVPSAFEASLKIQKVPMTNYTSDPNQYFELWRIANVPQDQIDKAVLQLYLDYAGKDYGYLELPWFIWRKLNALVGRDIRSQANWSSVGTFCSQLAFDLMDGILFSSTIFAPYHANTCTPEDLRQLFRQYPKIFTMVYSNIPGEQFLDYNYAV